MEEKRRRAPLPPSYPVSGTEAGGSHSSVREIKNPAYVEADGSQGKKLSVPLPDYETLFPQKRHGVQGHTRWDHIIAEVNQKHRDTSPELLGPEMSVDSPEEYRPSPRSISLESPTMRRYHTQPLETKPVSTKKVAAPAPPKPITSSQTQPAADTSQSQDIVHRLRPDPFGSPGSPGSPGHINTAISSRENLSEMPRDGGKKALLPPSVTHASRPTSQMDETPQPTAKPRQRANGKEETQQEKSALFSQSGSSMDKTGGQAGFAEFDPLSSTGRLSKDQWAYQKQNQDVNNSFASNIKKEQKPQDPGMTTDDLDKIFNQDKPTDPFASFNGSGSNRHSEYKKKSDDSKEADFHAFQRRNSQRQKHSLQSRTHPDNRSFKSQQEPASKDKTTTAAANQSLPARNIANKSVALQPQADVKTQSNFFLEDPFGADPFPMPTALASLEPLQVVTEETAGNMSGGKTPLQAWVSPSEAQPVSAQNSNGGGLAFAPRRPHPVKPLTSVESQHATSGQAVKEIKVWDNTPGKIKVADSGQSGPYTQLTQEELITLVVKQQTDLSKKDAKIVELEEYIDNLVLRVIEEKPSILQTIPPAKQV